MTSEALEKPPQLGSPHNGCLSRIQWWPRQQSGKCRVAQLQGDNRYPAFASKLWRPSCYMGQVRVPFARTTYPATECTVSVKICCLQDVAAVISICTVK